MTLPYVLAIGPWTQTTPDQEVTFFSAWQLTRNLDDGSSMQINLPGDSLPAIAMIELETDVFLYEDGVLIERLRIVSIERTWNADGRVDMNVTAVDYKRLLASRFVNSSFVTSSTVGLAAMALISATQSTTNGSMGIAFGSDTTTGLVTIEFTVGSNILETIKRLALTSPGMAWGITPARAFYAKNANNFPYRPQPIELGNNAMSLNKPTGAENYANAIIATGDTANTTVEIVEDATLPTQPKGRWERYASFPSENSQTVLLDQATGLLENAMSPQVQYRFTLEPWRFFLDSDYKIGDFVTIVNPAINVPSSPNALVPVLTVPASMVSAQIISQQIEVSADGNLNVAMTAVTTGGA